jgi:hypothetical protein
MEMKTLLIIATGGFIFSITAHLASFLGIDPQSVFPPIWLLHIGIFVVWVPTIFLLRNTYRKTGGKGFWSATVRNAPPWMQALCIFFLIYTVFNFTQSISALDEAGDPAVVAEQKTYQSQGRAIEALTDEEFFRFQANTFRLSAGHWMVFYIVSMTILLSLRRTEERHRAEKGPDPESNNQEEGRL